MYTRLVEDTTKRNILEEVNLFQATDEAQQWVCSFCHPDFEVYILTIPPKSHTQLLNQTKQLIKTHMELHKADVIKRMAAKGELATYEKTRVDSAKRVRLWITGTVKDRGLYEDNPITNTNKPSD